MGQYSFRWIGKTMKAADHRQLELPFDVREETRQQRLERILSGQLRDKVKRASDRTFTSEAFAEATAQARGQHPPGRGSNVGPFLKLKPCDRRTHFLAKKRREVITPWADHAKR